MTPARWGTYPNFSQAEFNCRHTGRNEMKHEFMVVLQAIRTEFGRPMRVTSGGDTPTGYTTWGPWRLEIPKVFLERRDKISFLEVIGHYRCHGLWTQETLYGRVSVEMLP